MLSYLCMTYLQGQMQEGLSPPLMVEATTALVGIIFLNGFAGRCQANPNST